MEENPQMLLSDIDFDVPIFLEHPEGWRTPNELANGFVLAWALEMQERRRLAPRDPMGGHVFERLPAAFRFDTLGELVRPPMAVSAAATALTMRGRVTTLCIVWRLFEELNAEWRLRRDDYFQFGEILAFVTGGAERPSVFRHRRADMARCLFADRVLHSYQGSAALTPGEAWFATGDGDLLIDGAGGSKVIPFTIAGNLVPIYLVNDSFLQSVWAAAQLLVEAKSPEHYISAFGNQVPILVDVLERGSVLGEERTHLPPAQSWAFDPWPGWHLKA